VPGPFDCLGQASLVAGTGARLAPRPDPAMFRDVTAQLICILVINVVYFVHAESADAAAAIASSISHFLIPPDILWYVSSNFQSDPSLENHQASANSFQQVAQRPQ
jgi:hypothetical protein